MTGSNYLVCAFILLMAILIIVAIVKKVFKLLIFAVVLLVGFSAYNVIVKGVSPIDELKGYKKDFSYGKSIADYTVKIKDSANKIKEVAESGKIDSNAKNVITTENSNLHKYEKEVQTLEHTSKLNGFHQKYCGFLNDIATSSDGAVKVANASDGKNVAAVKGMADKLSSSINGLSGLSIKDFK